MENWQICETECLKYLKLNFADKYYNFEAKGGSDSKKSDILLTKNGISLFYIEAKMSKAQCGQFVAFPNEGTRIFEYSNFCVSFFGKATNCPHCALLIFASM